MIAGRLVPRRTAEPTAPWPIVGALVIIPRLNIRGWVNFLIDTGADFTCLHLPDSRLLNLDHSRLVNPMSLGGVGGERGSSYATEPAALAFRNTDDHPVVEPLQRLRIGLPDQSPASAPSLLGRDLLSRYELRLNFKTDQVLLV